MSFVIVRPDGSRMHMTLQGGAPQGFPTKKAASGHIETLAKLGWETEGWEVIEVKGTDAAG